MRIKGLDPREGIVRQGKRLARFANMPLGLRFDLRHAKRSIAAYYRDFRGLPHRLQASLTTLAILFLAAVFLPVSAATATLNPDSNITCGWATGCTYTNVDEGPTPVTTDYMATGTAGSGGEVAEFGLQNLANVASASQIRLWVYAQSATNANGGTLDSLSLNARINGTLQTATTVTPAFGSWGWYSATFSGSWTQADIDSLQAHITRNRLGGGNPSNQDDDVRVATVYVEVTYMPGASVSQQGYRFYQNSEAGVGSTYVKTWGGTGIDYGNSLVTTADGGYAVTGNTNSYGAGSDDMFLAKYDSAGTLSWSRTWGGTGIDYGNSLVTTADGGYAVTGYTNSYGAGSDDMFLAKYDSTGTLSWSRTWGGTGNDYGWSLVQTSDGGYAVTGQTSSYGVSSGDMFLAKYDSSGTLSWSRTWGGTDNDYGYALAATGDGGYAVAGYTASYGAGNRDLLLAKYDSSGTLSWSRTWGGTGFDYGRSLIQTADGGYAITGETSSYGAGNYDMFLAKYDSTGNISNCSSPMCQSPTPSTSSPTASTSSPTPSTSSPTASTSSPSPSTSTPSPTTTAVVPGPTGPQVSTPLAAMNTPATAPAAGTPFRLRLNLGVTLGDLTSGSYKLRYAPRDADNVCDNDEPGYADITTSTLIKFYDNSAAVDGMGYNSSPDDPTRSGITAVGQTYEEANNFSVVTTVPAGQDGLWDFALTVGDAPGNTSYCIKATDTAGADLFGGYAGSAIATITTLPTTTGQGSYRFFADSSGTSPVRTQAWGGTGNDYGYSLVTTADGGYAVTGYTTSYGAGSDDMFLAKYDSSGTLSWSRTWGGTGGDRGYSLVQASDGGFAVTGETASYGAGNTDMFLARYDSTGTLSWSRTWGGTGSDYGYSLVTTADGGYAVTGYTNSYGAGSDDMFLAKYDSAGTLSWSRTWGGTGSDYGNSLVTTADGGYAVTGQTASYGAGSNDMFLAKYDSAGTLSWSRTWGGTGSDYGYSLVTTTDGGYAVTGYTTSYGAGSADMFLARYDSTGTMAECPSGMCQSPSASTSSPTASTSSPTASTSSPTASTSSPTASTSSPTATVTPIVGGSTVAGTPLAAQDTAANVAAQTPFRLRTLGSVDGTRLAQNGQNMKLQYAEKTGVTCDPNGAGYANVNSVSGGGVALNPAAVANDSSVGAIPWSNPSNAATSNNSRASVSQSDQDSASNYLVSSGHGFAIPTDAIVTGIRVNIEVSASVTGSAGVSTSSIKLVKGGTKSSDRSGYEAWPSSDTVLSYGSSSDLWGLTWTPADINSSSFGAAISANLMAGMGESATASVDAISIEVFYSTVGTISYYENSALTDNIGVATSAADPTSGRPVVAQSYRETDPFTNNTAAIPAGSDGLWDFSLTSSAAADGKTYCLRIVKSDGSPLDSYNFIAEIQIGTQGGGGGGPTLPDLLRGGQSVIDGVKNPFQL